MANENKNIKELVSDDDDPTAELEILSLQGDESGDSDEQRESDSHTYGLADSKRVESALGQSIPELQSDLESRTKTIGKLQYDIQQLRSKWLGLEAEISAREEIVSNLLQETGKLKKKVAHKDGLLNKRSQSIKALKSEIRQHNKDYALLKGKLEAQQSTEAENINAREASERAAEELRSELEDARAAIVSAKAEAERRDEQHRMLEQRLDEQQVTDGERVAALEEAERVLAELRSDLETARAEIVSAETEITQRDEQYRLLEKQLGEQQVRDAEHVAALEETERALEELRSDLETARAEIVSAETEITQRDEQYRLLEQQLAEQQVTDAEHVAALKDAERALASLRAELEAAVHDEQNLNTEISQREELEFLLEQKSLELEKQLSEQRARDAENIALLNSAQKDLEMLTSELEATRKQSAAEIAQTQNLTSTTVQELREQLAKSEQYADTLRWNFQDLSGTLSALSRDRDDLRDAVARMTESDNSLSAELDAARNTNAELSAALEQLRADHQQEIRTLRFELGEAQESVAQTNDLNSQLASDLIDTRVFKEELERMLTRNEEDAQQRITDLETQIGKLANVAEEFEQKLDTKNTAINVLLGELSKKSEQIDSIGEIEDVIQEIDSRMSEKIDEPNEDAVRQQSVVHVASDRDRITRVLVGNVGDQELRFPLFKDRLTIGRTAENDIQLKTAYISRRHAVVLTEGDATRVIDWGSKNGVYVNSERVKERILSNGDIVSVGNAKFRYEERPKRDS
jgi:chromosome segregation ATPase